MPSRLRYQQDFEPVSVGTIRPQFKSQPPQKKQKMSLTATYYIASSARAKLGKEACRPDHNLRLLVGHANLLDALMLDLHDAEREQEAWFNQTVQKAQKAEEPKHIQWADTIVEEEEKSDSEDDSSESDSEFDEEEFEMELSLKRLRSAPVTITTEEMDDDEEYYDDDEESSELALTRTQSRSSQSPPELVDDSDSEDDAPPASPPQLSLDLEMFDEKSSDPTLSESQQAAFFDDGYFIPERTTAPMTMIAAC
ncbi:hypothetical protein EG328_008570 [Venturia inaequalis]|uniref:Uncharacterized protein n=1 Tax=Venturia inaequalis TaxID=5025 RepID=A0A8H3V7C0_VENIN|nr:hypothetical protein EG328_008570 [Venturia inaequalis]